MEFVILLENFSLIWRRHHYRWRATNFDLCLALISIEQWGFVNCHTYCDTVHPFIMVISEDPWHSLLMPSVWQWSCHYPFNDWGLSRPGFEPSYPACDAKALPLRHRNLLINPSNEFHINQIKPYVQLYFWILFANYLVRILRLDLKIRCLIQKYNNCRGTLQCISRIARV